jgi:hypothetical protein
MTKIPECLKGIVAGAVTVLYAFQSAISDGTITNTEWNGIASLTVATALVIIFPNLKLTPIDPDTESDEYLATSVTRPRVKKAKSTSEPIASRRRRKSS